MHILVAYESQRGHTRRAAEAIASAVRNLNHQVILKPVGAVEPEDIEKASALFFGTWVQGFILFGVRPAGVKEWVRDLPALTGKPVGIFCTYHFNPRGALRTLGTMLEARGAVIQGERAFHAANPGENAADFVNRVLSVVTARAG